jgi:ATP-dependent Clp protease ATP-binding subunit ClpA
LARVIQEHVKKPLAEELLFGRLAKGGVVRVTRKDNKLTFTFSDTPPRAPAPKEPVLVE